MDEEEIYKGLGLDAPTEAGDADKTPAEDVDATAQADDAVDPPAADGEDATADEAGDQTESVDADAGDAPAAQTRPPQEYAGMMQASKDAMIAAMGLTDPYTGAKITSEAGYMAYKTRYDAELEAQRKAEAEAQLAAAGISREVLEQIVAAHPDVQAARRAAADAEARERAAAQAQAQEWYAGEIRQITELDPEIRTVDDLAAKHPAEFPKLLNAVRAGVPLSVAYKGTFFDTLASRRAAAARRAGAVQAAGKGHLQPVGGGGKAAIAVPDDVRALYRDIMPDMTEREIQEAYGKYVKNS